MKTDPETLIWLAALIHTWVSFFRSRRREKHNTFFSFLVLVWFLFTLTFWQTNQWQQTWSRAGRQVTHCRPASSRTKWKHQNLTVFLQFYLRSVVSQRSNELAWSGRFSIGVFKIVMSYSLWSDCKKWIKSVRVRPEFKRTHRVKQPPPLMKLRRDPSQYLSIKSVLETFGITYKLNSTRYTTTIESGAPVEDQTMENMKTFLSASCFNERRVSVLQSYSRSTQTWCFSHRQTFPPQMSVNKTFDISASHPCSHSGHKYKNAHTNSCSGWNPLIDDEPTSNPSSVLWNEPWDASFPPVAWNMISVFGVIVSGVLLLNMQSSLFSDIIRVNRRTESNESRMWRRWTEFCNKKLNKCFCYFLSDETDSEAEPDRRWSKAHVGQWLFT